ncbi:MAG: hypothetical protein NT154_23635, partial [Verrucomicrobia bacterium]|nr:hypothetical protein [Verrucomicrobiota bacterium]
MVRFISLLGVALACSAQAAVYDYSWTASNGAIPDNDPNGWADTQTVSGILQPEIGAVRVLLNLAGGWNGDLYVRLTYGTSQYAVLLNCAGSTSINSDGYGNTGFLITLSDAATQTHDAHLYQLDSPSYNESGQLTGTWR